MIYGYHRVKWTPYELALGLHWQCHPDRQRYRSCQLESALPTMINIYKVLASQYNPFHKGTPHSRAPKSQCRTYGRRGGIGMTHFYLETSWQHGKILIRTACPVAIRVPTRTAMHQSRSMTPCIYFWIKRHSVASTVRILHVFFPGQWNSCNRGKTSSKTQNHCGRVLSTAYFRQ